MKIKNICYQLGSKKISINEFVKKNTKKIIQITGIDKVFHVSKKEDIITLAVKASKKAIKKDKKIDVIIFITQTPKYNIPPSGYLIQKELNIQKKCMIFDMNMGCSGYIYGLKLAHDLLKTNKIKKILLITADNYSRYLKKLNVKLLFSDCATATVLEKSSNFWDFEFISDGNKYKDLCQESDNYEKSINENSLIMNGNNVFKFSITSVPKIIKKILKKSKNVKYIFLHQASKIVNENIQRNINISKNKFINAHQDYGNTVSSSIPLLLNKKFKNLKNKNIIMCGFGVGLSVGACYHEFK